MYNDGLVYERVSGLCVTVMVPPAVSAMTHVFIRLVRVTIRGARAVLAALVAVVVAVAVVAVAVVAVADGGCCGGSGGGGNGSDVVMVL